MPVRDHIDNLAPSLVYSSEPRPEPNTSIGSVLGASWEADSDIKAIWDLATAPQFERDAAFSSFEKTKNSPFWESPYRNSFAQAVSNDHWNYLAAKIQRERTNDEILDAAGWGGLAARLAIGTLSPTMLIPALTPYRGIKGVAAAGGLGALGGALQELPLQLSQETRTSSDIIMSIGTGAFLGGVLGGAYNLWRMEAPRVQVRSELDMAMGHSPSAISPSARLAAEPVIVRPSRTIPGEMEVVRGTVVDLADRPAGAKFVVANAEDVRGRLPEGAKILDEPRLGETKEGSLVLAKEEAQVLRLKALDDGYDALTYKTATGDEVVELLSPKLLKEIGADEFSVVQEGIFMRTPAALPGSLSAQRVVEESAGGVAGTVGGTYGDKVMRGLSIISPVARVIAQDTFTSGRRMMAKLSQGGLFLQGNERGLVANAGGTVETRAQLYDAYVDKLIRIGDDTYNNYLFDNKPPEYFANTRAALKSTFRVTDGKMTREQFNIEVSRAMIENDYHPIPQVQQAAQFIRQEIYDPILKEAKEVRLFDAVDGPDPSYFTRQYSTDAISADPNRFINIIAGHIEEKLKTRFAVAADRLAEQKAATDEFLKLATMPRDEAEALRQSYADQLKALGDSDAEVQRKALDREARQIRRESAKLGYKLSAADQQRLEEIRAEKKTLRENNVTLFEEKRTLQDRMNALDQSWWATAEEQRNKLQQIALIESRALEALNSVMTRGMKLRGKLDTLDPRDMAKQVDLFKEQVTDLYLRSTKAAKRFQQAEIGLRSETDAPPKEFLTYAGLRDRLQEQMERLSRVEDVYANIDTVREIIESVEREALDTANKLNLQRGERIARLKEQMDPNPQATSGQIIGEVMARQSARERAFTERMEKMGFTRDQFDPVARTVDSRALARSQAEEFTSKVLSLHGRIAGLDMLTEERGAALLRTMDIPSQRIFDFLEQDSQAVIKRYIRQVSADIELKREFGDVNGKSGFAELEREYLEKVAMMQKMPGSDREVAALQAKQAAEIERVKAASSDPAELEPLLAQHRAQMAELTRSPASPEEMTALKKQYDEIQRDLQGSILRIRKQWGIPTDPNSASARLGKVLLDLSTLRFMGGVLISSLPDMGKVVFRHGLERTFMDGIMPMVTNWKEFKASARELRLAGGALDAVIHSRAMAYADVLEQSSHSSLPERLIHTAATKIGKVALFDYWTSGLKSFAGVLDNARMMDSIELVITGKGSAAEVSEATRFLAQKNINAEIAQGMWEQMNRNGGSTVVDRVRYPNTENWDNPYLVRAYRTALRQASEETIVTPGLELPLIVNKNIGYRLLFQFKSFNFASHTKTMMHAMQQKDMAVVNGAAFMLAMGAASYYISATLAGGKMQEDMQKAGSGKWMDEAMNRSGIFAALGMVQQATSRIPGLRDVTTFSREEVMNRGGGGLVETLAGPTMDTATRLANIAVKANEPTKSIVRDVRVMLPFQNVIGLRRGFDYAEEYIARDLPERKEGK